MGQRVLENMITEKADIDEMQLGFVRGRGTTVAIFIVCATP